MPCISYLSGYSTKFYLNFDHLVVHPQPFEFDHKINLQSFFQFDAARRSQEIGQVNAFAVAFVRAGNVFNPEKGRSRVNV